MNTIIQPSKLHGRWTPDLLVWGALCLLLVTNIPLFLCMRLNGDATYYDLQAQCLQEGGVLYQDMLEPNFPGVVWIHTLLRRCAGWTSVALRAFDLLVLAGILTILLFRFRRLPSARSGLVSACLTLSVCWFYLSLSTWAHCQRDNWMLLPSLVAVLLRERNVTAMLLGRSRSLAAFSFIEGLMWATAFWIKPHVALPALCVLGISVCWSGVSRRAAVSYAGVLAGGLFLGGIGSGWLIATGAWPHFWETQLAWNPEYLSSRVTWAALECQLEILSGFTPWSWAHLIALPVACATLLRCLRARSGRADPASHPDCADGILSALYFGWVLQVVLLQHPFSYTHVPGVVLAIAIVAGIRWRPEWHLVPRTIAAAAFLIALSLSPCSNPQRLAAWMDCVTGGTDLATRATFQTRPGSYWADYPPLVEFLREREVRDKDVLVYSSMLIPLYRDLDLRPPTRYVLMDVHRGFFPSRQPMIREAVDRSPHKYVVTDLSGIGLNADEFERTNPRTGLPEALPAHLLRRFPLTQPVLFRSGCFVVHAARDTQGM